MRWLITEIVWKREESLIIVRLQLWLLTISEVESLAISHLKYQRSNYQNGRKENRIDTCFIQALIYLIKSINHCVLLFKCLYNLFISNHFINKSCLLSSCGRLQLWHGKGFFGNNHFILINRYLKQTNQGEINWNILNKNNKMQN